MIETTVAVIKYGYPDPRKLWEALHPKVETIKDAAERLTNRLGVDGYEFLSFFLPHIKEVKILKSGKNKGQEKITWQKEISEGEKVIIINIFTGLDSLNDLYRLSNFMIEGYYDVLKTTATEMAKRKPRRDLLKEIAYKWNWYVEWKRARVVLNKCNNHYKSIAVDIEYPEPEYWSHTKGMTEQEILGLDRDMVSIENVTAVVKAFSKIKID